ncbi:hypothetical protein M422DRAFT_56955, partial [Sphaerobolus stellatus SS14]
TRLTHLKPCEILLPPKISSSTGKMLEHFAKHGWNVLLKPVSSSHAGRIRVERSKEDFDSTSAFQFMSEQYENQSDEHVAYLMDLPQLVVTALAYITKHLSVFGLSDTVTKLKFFDKFSTRTHMLLDASTIRNLEIFRNQTDYTEYGSLFSVMDRTATHFGKRLLKSWICRPLIDRHMLSKVDQGCRVLQERVDAVEEARSQDSRHFTILRNLLKRTPDLARGLSNIQYGKCQPKELAYFLIALEKISKAFPHFRTVEDVGCSSSLWSNIIFSLPAVGEAVKEIMGVIDVQKAMENNKTELWRDKEKYPEIDLTLDGILAVESELADELKKSGSLQSALVLSLMNCGLVQKLLKIWDLKYTTVMSDEVR